MSLLAGCSGADPAPGSGLTTRMPDGLPGVYAGDFPCSNCAAIAAVLWLRSDERFFLRQSYVGSDGATDGGTYALGHWHWDPHAALIVLKGAGPERRIAWVDADHLQLHTYSNVEHVLTRDPLDPPFGDALRLDGESIMVERNAVFTECLTGLQLQVADDAGFTELRRRHRVVGSRGKSALTGIDGRIIRVADGDSIAERLVIERIVDLKPGVGC